MSVGSEVLRRGHNRLLRAWLAVAAVLAAGAVALTLWATFGSSSITGGTSGNEGGDKKATITRMYPDGRFGAPIQVGDFVCHQCR